MAYDKLSNYATTIERTSDGIRIVYHSTAIVETTKDRVILRTGGHSTVTTKKKMNQASNQFNLGYQVYQKDFDWYVVTDAGTFEFNGDEFTFHRVTGQKILPEGTLVSGTLPCEEDYSRSEGRGRE